MPGAFLIPADGDLHHQAPVHTVATRAAWGDDWTPRAYLYANTVRWASGSVRPEATISWPYGQLLRPTEAVWNNETPLDLLDQYVKIEITQAGDNLIWYGILTDVVRRRDGAMDWLDAPKETGDQLFTAEGLDLLLLRTFFDTSWVRKSDGDEEEIGRGLTFNDPNTFDDEGNRCRSPLTNNAYVFAHDLYDANWWSTKDILHYLLTFHAPKDAKGESHIDWKLSADAKAVLPDWDRPVVKTAGRSIRSIINELCDRRRLLSWSLRPENSAAGPAILLDVAPFNASPLTLPSGKTQQANPNQVQLGSDGLAIDGAVDVMAGLRDSAHHQVDQVVVRGARRRAVVSFGAADGTLEADWTTADQTAYTDGPDLTGVDDTDRQEARIADWQTEERFHRVYSWFRLPADWDGKVGDGTGSYSSQFYPETVTWYMPELRFARHLPKELRDAALETSPRSLPPPLALIQVPDIENPDSATTTRYRHLDRLANTAGIERTGEDVATGAGRQWAASVRMQPDAPGVIVKIHGHSATGGQHLLADEVDWETIILTVMIELEASVEERYPADDDVPASKDVSRVVYVDLGERARLDWVHRLAVVDLLDGELQYRNGATPGSEGEYVRDDRDAMKDLAKFLYEWYGNRRAAFTLQLKQITSIVSVGDLITEIGEDDTAETVNALVTGIEMDLLAGTSRITTGYAELDPIQLF